MHGDHVLFYFILFYFFFLHQNSLRLKCLITVMVHGTYLPPVFLNSEYLYVIRVCHKCNFRNILHSFRFSCRGKERPCSKGSPRTTRHCAAAADNGYLEIFGNVLFVFRQ
jgi:hypothetical protein